MEDPGKILIFGASGHIGAPLVRFLCYKGWSEKLRLATSRPDKLDGLRAMFPQCEAVAADYLSRDSLAAAFKGIKRVFIITPDFIDERAAMTNVIEIAGTVKLDHVIRILGDPPNMSLKKVPDVVKAFGRGTAIQHLHAKEVLDQSDLPITYLNIASYLMDDFIRWSGPIKAHGTLTMPFDRRTTWIDPGDLGEAAARILMSDDERHVGQLYHLNNGSDLLLFSEISVMISEVLQKNIAYNEDIAYWMEMMGRRYSSLFGEGADEYFREYYRFEQKFQWAFHRSDILARILGRTPKSLRAWLEQNGQYLL
jgi:uncharacterized protein YbjT (DUF2867 family)